MGDAAHHKAIIMAALDHAISESKSRVVKAAYELTLKALEEGKIGITDGFKPVCDPVP